MDAWDPNTKLAALLETTGSSADVPTDITLGDLWRVNGWCDGSSAGTLENLTVKQIKHINHQIENHMRTKSKNQKWKHCNDNESSLCGCCTCAVESPPED